MARTRLLSPKFFRDQDLAACSPHARLAFEGIWLQADRDGRLEDIPKVLGAEIFPFEDVDMDALLDELARPRKLSPGGFIVRYQVKHRRYIWIRNFREHQKPHMHEPESKIPPPNGESPEVVSTPTENVSTSPEDVRTPTENIPARSPISDSDPGSSSDPGSETVSRPRPREVPAEPEPLDAAEFTAELVSEINRHLPALRLKATPGVTAAVSNLLAVGHPKGVVYAGNGRRPFAREDLVDATHGWIIAESGDRWHLEQRGRGSPYTFARLVQDPDRLTEYAERGRSGWASWQAGDAGGTYPDVEPPDEELLERIRKRSAESAAKEARERREAIRKRAGGVG